MDKWLCDITRPKAKGIVDSVYVKTYGNIALKEIRHGKFNHIDQAILLLDDESKEVRSAVIRSLKWALQIACTGNNQKIIDKIFPYLVLESL